MTTFGRMSRIRLGMGGTKVLRRKRFGSSFFAGAHEAVGDGEEGGGGAGVGGDFLVEGSDGVGGFVVVVFVGDFSAAEHVVEDHESAEAEELEGEFVVGVVGGFVG